MMNTRTSVALVSVLAFTIADEVLGQRKSKPVLRLNSAQLGAPPPWSALVPPARRGFGNNARPVIMLTGYWPPTNEMIRRFSTNTTQNPNGWIGSNWENRGYDIYSFFPEFPSGSFPKGVGDFEIDYQDTVADWARITRAMTPRAIITFSRGGSTRNWELEMNAHNHQAWAPDSLPPRYPNPSPPDPSLPANTSRRSTLPAREVLAALSAAQINVNGWACFIRSGGNYLSEFISYHGVWYKNTHSDRTKTDWCVAAGHIHVGSHTISVLEQAVFVTLRELIKHVDRVTSGHEQQNYGYGHRGTAILGMGGAPFQSGGKQDLLLTGVPINSPLVLLLSRGARPTPYNTGVYVTNPFFVAWPTTASGAGTFELKGIASGGPGTIHAQFVYPSRSVPGAVGITNALEIQFK